MIKYEELDAFSLQLKIMGELSTEEKIKKAAADVFMKKGFAGTRTRDIAEAADINLALLNYYYRSKEKLFEIIMLEAVSRFTKDMFEDFNDPKTSLKQKIEQVSANQIDFSLKNMDMGIFLLNEMRKRPHILIEGLSCYGTIQETVFYKQVEEQLEQIGQQETKPMQIIITMMGMVAYPFISKPLMEGLNKIKEGEFETIMLERKSLIPLWMNAILRL